MMNYRLVKYDNVITKLQEKVATLTDPESEEETPSPLYENVRYIIPDKISLFGGSLAVIRFKRARLEQEEIGEPEIARIPGAIFTLLPGDHDEAFLKCLRYSDILGAYLENSDLLGMRGVRIGVLKGDAQNWDVLNVSRNPKLPVLYTFAVTGFEIIIQRDTVI